MYCGKCGKELPEGSVFCRFCGNSLRAGGNEQQGQPSFLPTSAASVSSAAASVGGVLQRILDRRLLLPILAVIVAAAVVVTAVFTSGFGLFAPKLLNPVALIYDGIAGLTELDSFRFDVRMADGSDYSPRVEGYVKYGSGVEDMVVHATAYTGRELRGEIAIYEGALYTYESWADTWEYIELDDLLDQAQDGLSYALSNIDEVEPEELQDEVRESLLLLQDMATVKYIDGFFTGGHFDREKLLDTLLSDELAGKSARYAMEFVADQTIGRTVSYEPPSEKAMRQLVEWAESFIYVGLEDEEIASRVLLDLEETKEGKYTTFDCSVDYMNGAKEYLDYLADHYEDYPELGSEVDRVLETAGIREMLEEELNVNLNLSVPDALDMAKSFATAGMMYLPEIETELSVTVDRRAVLQEAELLFREPDYGYDMSFQIEISEHNEVEIDEDELARISRDAEKASWF